MIVNWSDKAKSRLKEIHHYIAKDSPMHADAVVDRLTRRSTLLRGGLRGCCRTPVREYNGA